MELRGGGGEGGGEWHDEEEEERRRMTRRGRGKVGEWSRKEGRKEGREVWFKVSKGTIFLPNDGESEGRKGRHARHVSSPV